MAMPMELDAPFTYYCKRCESTNIYVRQECVWDVTRQKILPYNTTLQCRSCLAQTVGSRPLNTREAAQRAIQLDKERKTNDTSST